MVAAVRAGHSQRAVARAFGVSLATVQLWLHRAAGRRLDRVDWTDQPSVRHRLARTAPPLEDLILELRRELRASSILGEYGALAIRRELLARPDLGSVVPAARTISRILERRGALDSRRRVRRPPPPPGWYLPELAARRVELDSFDIVDGLYLKGQPELGILTGVSLHGGLPGAWPAFGMRVGQIVPALVEHWRAFGRPAYAQFDNDPRFIGGLAKPDSIGPVIRLCLALNIVPVFAPPHEMGFQNAVEGFNGLWQDKVWGRFRDPTLDALQIRSGQWIHALRQRSAVRIEAAPVRDPFPSGPLEPWQPPKGRMVFLRRATEAGTVSVLGHHLLVDRHWPWRLVRAELDLTTSQISFFASRKREPIVQPLLSQAEYPIPDRWYR